MKVTYCAKCGNPDCVNVSTTPYWYRCPADPMFGTTNDVDDVDGPTEPARATFTVSPAKPAKK